MGIWNRIKTIKSSKDGVAKQSKEVAEEKKTELLKETHKRQTLEGIIVKPLISEKSAALAGSSQYVFVVSKGANRIQVRTAIKEMYGVSPLAVNVLNVRGKKVRFGRRKGKKSDWKKAIVTLAVGQTINVYEGV